MGWRPRDQFQRFRWGRPVRLQPPMGAWVGGLELDISGANVKGMANVPVLSSTSIVTTPAPIVTQTENFHLLGSARARIGFLAWPNLLLYGTGGLAWTRFEQRRD